MTPFQLAKAECSNFRDGACQGIGIHNDGRLFGFRAKPACVLSNRKARCAYFEQCVLPTRFEDTSAAGQVRAKAHQEAVNLYVAGTTGRKPSKHSICPVCRKREIEPPKRFCYECAANRKLQATVESNRRRRHDGKTASKTPANIGPNDAPPMVSI